MRILHLVASIGRRSGGVGLAVAHLAREQRNLHETEVWCLGSPAEVEESTREYSLEGYVTSTPILGPVTIGYSPKAEQLASSDIGSRYDILHQHGIWMANSRVTNRWRARFMRPTVVAPHGSLQEHALRFSTWKKKIATFAYEGKNLQSASCLHATSEMEAERFRKLGLYNPIAIIPNGLPDVWFQSMGDRQRFRRDYSIPEDKRLLLYLSRLHPIKGLPLLFEAVSFLRREMSDWWLVIGGPDEVGHRRELELLAGSLGIHDRVRFVGPLSGNRKRDALAAADLFVLPTYSENFGIVVAEALGAGVPVLTTHGAPWHELAMYQCGWWVDAEVSAIQDALLDAVRRPERELAEMGQRGKALVYQKYTWREVATKSLLLYDWLLGRGEEPDFVIKD